MNFFIRYLHLNFHSFLRFQHGSGSSVKAIMLAILAIVGLSFLGPKELCLPNQFSRGYWQKHSVSIYILNLMSKKKLAHCACHDMKLFWPASFVRFPRRYWTEFSQSWKNLRKTLWRHENLWSMTNLSSANTGFHSNSRDWLFWIFMMPKFNPLINKSVLFWQDL